MVKYMELSWSVFHFWIAYRVGEEDLESVFQDFDISIPPGALHFSALYIGILYALTH